MAQTLKDYVRETVEEAAKGYTAGVYAIADDDDKAQALRTAFRDASQGVNTGWWSGLIYTRDVYRMADRHRRDIAEAVVDYANEMTFLDMAADNLQELWDALAACTLAPTFAEWEAAPSADPDDGTDNDAFDAHADALMFGLRFAVEWLVSEVASEMGVVL